MQRVNRPSQTICGVEVTWRTLKVPGEALTLPSPHRWGEGRWLEDVTWRTLKAPGGRPASLYASASRVAVSGVRGDGLKTTVLPHASAVADFHTAIWKG